MKIDRIHESAELFPMLPQDELSELALDISSNGLNHPLVYAVIDGENVLIDGRNRLAACKLADIEPRYLEFEGDDIEAFILSENINRRHMDKGQRAMAVAMMFPEKRQGKKNTSLKFNEVSSGYIRQARTVLAYAPTLAKEVLAGNGSKLHQAYDIAKQIKADHESKTSAYERLKSEAPELVALVDDESLSVEEALRTHKERIKEREAAEKANRHAAFKLLASVFQASELFHNEAFSDHYSDLLSKHPDEFTQLTGRSVHDLKAALVELSNHCKLIRKTADGIK